MKRIFKKSLRAALACLMLVSSLPAMATSHTAGYLAYVVKNTMKVYKSPSVLSPEMGTMSYGEDVRVLAWKDSWIRVQNHKGQIGYCEFGGLSTRNPNSLNIDAYVKESGAYVFAKPGTGYKTLGAVTMGKRLTALAMTPDKRWVRVSNGTRIGYIQSDALSKTPTSFHTALTRVWIVSNSAASVTKTRDGWDEVGIVSHGQYYELIGRDNGYAHIRNTKGETGWIQESFLSPASPNTLNKTMYAQVSGNILYPNSIIRGSGAKLSRGEAVKAVAITPDGGWIRVLKDGKYYYVLSELLAETKSPESGRILKCSLDTITVYKTSTISRNVVAYLTKGEKVQLIGVGGNCGLKIRTQSGIVGYVAGGLVPA